MSANFRGDYRVTTRYTWDALNRIKSIDQPGTDQDVTYQWDTGTNGVGYLHWRQDAAGQVGYVYNGFGDVTQQRRIVGGTLRISQYDYNEAGERIRSTTPSGRVIRTNRDPAGRVNSVGMVYLGQTQNIAYGAKWQPFDGDVTTFNYSNGLTYNANFFMDGKMENQQAGSWRQAYQYDPQVGTMTGMYASLPNMLWTFGHDSQYRVDTLDSQTATYDRNGNRTSYRWQASTYAANSNRIARVGGQAPIQHNAAGNIVTSRNGSHQYAYDKFNRLSSFRLNGVLRATYTYNALGQRTAKKRYNLTGAYMDTTFYFYNPEGVLESELIGTRFTDYLYLENRPLAMARSTGELWYLHTDHLGSVRAATDRQRQIIWRWESDAFGNGRANDNPNGGRIRTEINLRFPGQYYDSESGLHYNYYRYYDPTLGRYTRVDPIGLKGGMNPYLYVNANPLQLWDYFGLDALTKYEDAGLIVIVGDPLGDSDKGEIFKGNDGVTDVQSQDICIICPNGDTTYIKIPDLPSADSENIKWTEEYLDSRNPSQFCPEVADENDHVRIPGSGNITFH